MRLMRLTLRNFKAVRDFSLEPRGADVSVFGSNGAGKTTVADAWSWLLFGKDSAGRADFEVKTLDASGEALHGLEHSVEAVLEIDGAEITLTRTFHEVMTRKRGSAAAVFTGHTTEYAIDGVPVREAEYKAKVAEIAPEAAFRLLTDVYAFNALPWQKRRAMLLDICGDISDEQVVASDPNLRELPSILGRHTIDEHRKVVAARRAEINAELQRIPVRIDEVQRGLPAEVGRQAEIEEALAALRLQRQAAEAERSAIRAGGAVAGKQAELARVKVEISDAHRRIAAGRDEAIAKERRLLAEAEDVGQRAALAAARARGLGRDAEAEIGRLESRMEALRAEWRAVAEQDPPAADAPDTCPACGQPLPPERVQAARQEAEAAFNARKAARLEEISAEGKRLKARAESLRSDMAAHQAEAAKAEQEAAAAKGQAEEFRRRIESIRDAALVIDDDPALSALYDRKTALDEEIAALQQGEAGALRAVTERIQALDAEIGSLETALGAIRAREQGLRRIDDLKAQERDLAAEFERLEREIWLMEQFIRAKVAMLTERINDRFRLCRWTLFEQQVNGGLAETCVLTHGGVPYPDLNHGAKVNCGLECIDVLAEHYGVAPPVFIDGAESVVDIAPTKGQQIRLVVSAADPVLRVEYAAKEAVA